MPTSPTAPPTNDGYIRHRSTKLDRHTDHKENRNGIEPITK